MLTEPRYLMAVQTQRGPVDPTCPNDCERIPAATGANCFLAKVRLCHDHKPDRPSMSFFLHFFCENHSEWIRMDQNGLTMSESGETQGVETHQVRDRPIIGDGLGALELLFRWFQGRKMKSSSMFSLLMLIGCLECGCQVHRNLHIICPY